MSLNKDKVSPQDELKRQIVDVVINIPPKDWEKIEQDGKVTLFETIHYGRTITAYKPSGSITTVIVISDVIFYETKSIFIENLYKYHAEKEIQDADIKINEIHELFCAKNRNP